MLAILGYNLIIFVAFPISFKLQSNSGGTLTLTTVNKAGLDCPEVQFLSFMWWYLCYTYWWYSVNNNPNALFIYTKVYKIINEQEVSSPLAQFLVINNCQSCLLLHMWSTLYCECFWFFLMSLILYNSEEKYLLIKTTINSKCSFTLYSTDLCIL